LRVVELLESMVSAGDPLTLFELLFAHAPVAFQIYGRDGKCRVANHAFHRLFGDRLDHGRPELPELQELINRAFGGEIVSLPPRWFDRESARVSVAATFFPLCDRFRQIGHVGVLFDELTGATAQREAAEAARVEAERSERRAQFLADAGKLLATSLDPEPTLESIARLAVPEFADRCNVELGGTPCSPLFTPDCIRVPLAARGRTLGSLRFAYDVSGRHYGPADVRVAEELACRAALALDNARLYAEADAARREAEIGRRRLHALVSQAPAYVFILRGREHHLELMNAAFSELVGDIADAAGKPLCELLPEAVRTYLPVWDHVYNTGEPFEAKEVYAPLLAADGTVEERCFNFVLQPLRSPGGEVDGVMSFGFDISNEVLARRRIDAARKEAEAANRAKDEFLAMLGHELRNPLAPIATAVQLMQLQEPPSELQGPIAVLDRQLKHVTRLVDDLLDVSRITRGKIQLKRSRLEAAQVIGNAVEMSSPLLEQRRHRLRVHVPKTGLLLEVDDARLQQVVSNLLTNAAKYTEPGGEITVVGEEHGGWIEIRVRDNGRGIPLDMLPRIFDLFVQGQRSSDRAEGGLGLGLALVRSLVELHGGSVAARSDGPGSGSEFIVRLPRAAVDPPLAQVAIERVSAEGAAACKRVLLVDDNQDAAELLGEVLRSAGHTVAIAHDGAEALGLLRRFRPEVAVLDIGLPVMDGYELARRLRAEPELASLRCIAVTGYGQETDRARSRSAGFELHLVKPVDLSALLQALEN
jgi:signal transduction histidine kinase